ncbi:MAG: YHS domain-containing protein [Leptolyngbya sp. SIO4C1]|nr:YHS domain-containing protein [Leptolyngbya sp. SIO4C1]
MILLPRVSSAIAATLGLCLMVGCTSDPVTSVDETTPAVSAETVPAETPSAETQAATAPSEGPAAVFAEDGVAIRGADSVAYFTVGEYVPGSADFTHDWGGATWQFASAENRDLFASNPEQYAPQYGGFCAWAVSQGSVAPIDPTAWRIVDDRLYLNVSPSIQERWEKDIPGNIAKADQNWPGVLNN